MILKKRFRWLLLLGLLLTGALPASADQSNTPRDLPIPFGLTWMDSIAQRTYQEIEFPAGDVLSPEVFALAWRGYMNLQAAGLLRTDKQVMSVIDFSRSSCQDRLWVIDLKAHKVIYHTYVAHGQGSGMDMATSFSNREGSHASSLGFYVTGDTYVGQHGNSLRLLGMDKGFNDAALDRGIVVHAAGYVSDAFIANEGRLGRSWGCPALNPEIAQSIIRAIQDGTCLFIYYPQADYLKSSGWLNRHVESLPALSPVLHQQPCFQVASLRNEDAPKMASLRVAKHSIVF